MSTRASILFLFFGIINLSLAAQDHVQRLGVLQFLSGDGKVGTASFHRSGYAVENLTKPGKKGETPYVELGDVLARIEALQAEGWQLKDMNATGSSYLRNGSLTAEHVYLHTWYLAKDE